MPVKSEKQRRFMYASLAGKTDVPPSVAKKFVGPKAHSQGGAIKESEMKLKFDKESGGGSSVMPGRVGGAPGLKYTYKGNIFAKGGEAKESPAMVKKEVSFMKKKGAPAAMIKHEKAARPVTGGPAYTLPFS